MTTLGWCDSCGDFCSNPVTYGPKLPDLRGTRTAAELLAERRAKGLTAADLPWSPGVYFTPDESAP